MDRRRAISADWHPREQRAAHARVAIRRCARRHRLRIGTAALRPARIFAGPIPRNGHSGGALAYAREKCGRADWQFVRNFEPTIPAPDAFADFVTFFSVFTHLLDEDIFRFLAEAHRVLKPG